MSKIQLPPTGLAEDFAEDFFEDRGEEQLVTFSLGEKYGVPISQVQEIIRVGNITIVPNSPSYIEGVINLRGRVLPVLNMRKKMSLPASDLTKHSRIIVTEVNNKLIGLLVDGVSHVIKVDVEQIEAAPEDVLEVDTDYIKGVIKLQDQLIILLDLEKLLRREKLELKEGGDYENENKS